MAGIAHHERGHEFGGLKPLGDRTDATQWISCLLRSEVEQGRSAGDIQHGSHVRDEVSFDRDAAARVDRAAAATKDVISIDRLSSRGDAGSGAELHGGVGKIRRGVLWILRRAVDEHLATGRDDASEHLHRLTVQRDLAESIGCDE